MTDLLKENVEYDILIDRLQNWSMRIENDNQRILNLKKKVEGKMESAETLREAQIKYSVAERNEEKKKKLLLSDKLEATLQRQIDMRLEFGKSILYNRLRLSSV